jgi:hypothetical protein
VQAGDKLLHALEIRVVHQVAQAVKSKTARAGGKPAPTHLEEHGHDGKHAADRAVNLARFSHAAGNEVLMPHRFDC